MNNGEAIGTTKVPGLREIQSKAIGLEVFFWFGFAAYHAFNVASMLELGWSPAEATQMILWTFALTMICQPILGRLTDHYWGEKKLVTTAFLIFAVAELLMPLSLNSALRWPLVVNILFCTFFGYQMMSFLDAWIVGLRQDVPELNYGLIRGSGSVAFAISALLLGQLSQRYGFELRYWIGATSLLISVLFALRLPAPSHRQQAQQPQLKPTTESPDFRESLKLLMAIPSYPLLIIAGFLIVLGHNTLMTLNPVVIKELGGGAAHVGMNFAVTAFVELPMMKLMAKIYPRTKASKLFFLAGFVFGLRLVLNGLVSSLPSYLALQSLQGLSFAIIMPTSMIYLAEILPKRVRATGVAIFTSIAFAGSGIFSNVLSTTLLARNLSTQAILLYFSIFCFAGCALIVWGQRRKVW